MSPSPHTSADTLDFSDRVQTVAANDTNSFGKMLEGINKDINRDVEDRIKRGDYVPPPGQPDAASAAHQAVEGAMKSGPILRDDGMTRYGGGQDAYADKSRAATGDIDTKERQIAKERWDALSPQDRKTIETEKAAREEYDRVMIYRSKYDPPATPHLDAFTRDVGRAIAPLEQQRDQRLHQVWKELPVENKAAIFRSIEEKKHFRAL